MKGLLRFYSSTKKFLFPILLSLLVVTFYYPTLFQGKLPIPSDTIVGLYHPYRDIFADDYPRGVPFKNFLITDPVRQTFVWKELAIDMYKKMELPLWNPYEMTGKPLLGNFQTGAFYPLNILLFITPFSISWTVFIILQTVLAGSFMYAFLRNVKLSRLASVIGATSFTFSSFAVMWLEWGNIVHTFLWLPLILLSIDKLLIAKGRTLWLWCGVYVLAFGSAMFAGHLQTFFYLAVVSLLYFLFQVKRATTLQLLLFFALTVIVVVISLLQLYPTLQFVFLSARSIDQNYLTTEGWFIPFQHLIQFIAPDFFGNPTTLNYWGEWNYAELGGYIGVASLMLVPFAFFVKRKIVVFFLGLGILGLLFATDNSIARIPFRFDIPLISSSQPTRLLSVVVFSLAVLSSFGAEYVFRSKARMWKLFPLLVFIVCIVLLWLMVKTGSPFMFNDVSEVSTAQRNLLLPTALIVCSSLLIAAIFLIKHALVRNVALILLIALLSFDLLRYAWKFTPFTSQEYLFPNSKIINFLKQDKDVFRVAATDQRIMAPNFFTHHKIQTIEGYDPLYLKSYGEFIASLERGEPSIATPYGFNRIITPHNLNSPLMNFLNVKYVLSFSELPEERFKKVMSEGETILYENLDGLPRAFFVKNIIVGKDDNEVITMVHENNLRDTGVVNVKGAPRKNSYSVGNSTVASYSENRVVIATENSDEGFLVLSDAYYPTWSATIDGKKTVIYPTNHAFRGVVVPAGKHTVEFNIAPF